MHDPNPFAAIDAASRARAETKGEQWSGPAWNKFAGGVEMRVTPSAPRADTTPLSVAPTGSSLGRPGQHGTETKLSFPQRFARAAAALTAVTAGQHVLPQLFADKGSTRETPAAMVDRSGISRAQSSEHADPPEEPLDPEKAAEVIDEGIERLEEEIVQDLKKRRGE